jgi:hypothetical protein
MYPAVRPGVLAYVNPHVPPRIDESCVFRRDADDGVMILQYLGQTDDHWQARQLNPPHEITLDRREWPACHMIVGNHLID